MRELVNQIVSFSAGQKNKMKNNKKDGFTLVELLVVISIIAILTVVTIGSFVESQERSRDAARKSNLKSLSEAVSLYYVDVGSFPATTSFSFGGELSHNGTIYMKKTPSDTTPQIKYEVSGTGKSFRLIIKLENDEDKDCIKRDVCGGSNLNFNVGTDNCCYVITSSNMGPLDDITHSP